MQKLSKLWPFIVRQPRWRWLVALGVIVAVTLFWTFGGARSSTGTPSFSATRGPLDITVLEGGSLQALESQEIKCEVRVGYQGTKILKIVDEGYLVTEDDVKNRKVLVELDSSELQKQIVQQEIQYQSAVAALTDAQQSYEIQLNQNQSDVQAAEQKARFARLDFDKFLGAAVTAQIIHQVGLDALLAAAATNNVAQTEHAELAAPPAKAQPASKPQPTLIETPGEIKTAALRITNALALPPGRGPTGPTPPTLALAGAKPKARSDPDDLPDAEPIKPIVVDFAKFASIESLGDGEAKQKLRKFEDDLQVALKELGQAKTTLEGTRRLFDKNFVTKTDLQRDEIAFENSRLKVQTAETARDLFLKYDFLKSAEESLSKYADAVREFDKSRRVAVSRLAQAKAKLKSAIGQHEVQLRQRNDFQEQLEKCTIRAQKTGLVVYGGARDDQFYYGGEERVREGATVRERQAIITIPDLTRMSVNVKIHESYIKKVKKGQKAKITVDAFPDQVLTGEVTKMGVLPDSQNRWMNPDLKVYLTTITVDGTHDWVKPGMSAKVEILVNRLDNCVYVPIQAVSPDNGKQFCFVSGGLKPERREVETGDFNDEFIEIKKGIVEGERVLLRPPDRTSEPGKTTEPDKSPKKDKPSTPDAVPVQTTKA
jgi:multidrug resistance efflux pump